MRSMVSVSTMRHRVHLSDASQSPPLLWDPRAIQKGQVILKQRDVSSLHQQNEYVFTLHLSRKKYGTLVLSSIENSASRLRTNFPSYFNLERLVVSPMGHLQDC